MKNKKLIDIWYWPLFILLMSLLAFLCFYHLGDYDLVPWDELRHGLNAYEMLKKNNYLVNYASGEIDYWNVKPPLHFYFVMLGYKIFGYNPLGLRFFSALAYLILVSIIALFLKKKTNQYVSLISIIIFSVSVSFFYHHFVRTGDADSLYILFIGIALISLTLSNKNTNWLHLTGLMFALAFLTKSWHTIVLIPIIFFYWLWTKMYKSMKWWQYLTCCLCAIIPILIWAIARFNFDSFTFFKKMFWYDLFDRTTTVIDNYYTNNYPTYYIVSLNQNPIQFICLILFLINLTIKIFKKQKLTDIDKLCLISFFSIFILFTIAQTKHVWYIYPTCIPLTIGGATSVIEIYQLLKKQLSQIIFYSTLIITTINCLYLTTKAIDTGIYIEYNNEIIQMIKPYYNHNEQLVNIFYEYHYEQNKEKKYDYWWHQHETLPLVLEWNLDTIISHKWGGYNNFIQEKNSYLFMSREEFENKDVPDYIKIIGKSKDFVFCYNALT